MSKEKVVWQGNGICLTETVYAVDDVEHDFEVDGFDTLLGQCEERLRTLGEVLRRRFEGTGLVCRWLGEELRAEDGECIARTAPSGKMYAVFLGGEGLFASATEIRAAEMIAEAYAREQGYEVVE